MELKGSLPHSQVLATCPYSQPAPSSPCPHIPLPENPYGDQTTGWKSQDSKPGRAKKFSTTSQIEHANPQFYGCHGSF